MQVGFKSLLTLHLILSRSLAYHSGKVFVGDIGKNRVFVLDNTMEVETIGETGNGRLQFKVLRFWSDLRGCVKCSSLKHRHRRNVTSHHFFRLFSLVLTIFHFF